MIKLKEIRKIYANGDLEIKALDGINLNIEKGELTAIIGSSGSGKSTLLNILGILDDATSGEYLLDNISINELEEDEYAEIRNKKIGFVFQSFNLLPKLSALENVELPLIYAKVEKKERIRRAKEALARVGLADRIKHKPTELSGGQKQRVAVARALVTNPAIILADEPTGNLDSHSEEEIMKMFTQLNEEGATIIIVTHEPEIANKCKRIIHFKDGKIISDEKKVIS